MNLKKLTTNLTTALVLSGLCASVAMGADPITPQSDDQQKSSTKTEAALSHFPEPTDFVAVDTQPEATFRQAPEYPRLAQRVGLEGRVYVQALIDTSGEVAKAIVGRSTGAPILDQAALDAAYKCKYKPAMRDGQPVAYWVTYKVKFEIPKSETASVNKSESP
jgi:TonB family protein